MLFLLKWIKYKHFRSTLEEEFHLIHLSSFIEPIQILNSRSSHFRILGANHGIFQASPSKKCFSVFLLNTINSNSTFGVEFKFKEKSVVLIGVHIYFTFSLNVCFFVFLCWNSMSTRYVLMLLQDFCLSIVYILKFKISQLMMHWMHEMFQISSSKIVFVRSFD